MFLAGDVMTGRGIDQALAHPSPPILYEPYIQDARDYVALAEQRSGDIPRPMTHEAIWGDALDELTRVAPDARIVNLETSITTSAEAWPGKGIHYRMHPANIGCLTAARLDVCTLANNHVLDWGRQGLIDTLAHLTKAGLYSAGAGRTLAEAQRPATLQLPYGGRLLIFAVGVASSGISDRFAATENRAGVFWLYEPNARSLDEVLAVIERYRRPGDRVVVSLHWGENWGDAVPKAHVAFAHGLVDHGVDLVHGHSSHHPRAIEVYRERLVLYGCGDLINDYEGIRGYEAYRPDLCLLYFARLARDDGRLRELSLTPMRLRRFSLVRATDEERSWMRARLRESSAPFGASFESAPLGQLMLAS